MFRLLPISKNKDYFIGFESTRDEDIQVWVKCPEMQTPRTNFSEGARLFSTSKGELTLLRDAINHYLERDYPKEGEI